MDYVQVQFKILDIQQIKSNKAQGCKRAARSIRVQYIVDLLSNKLKHAKAAPSLDKIFLFSV